MGAPAQLWTDVDFGGHRYQVGRFKARDGSWIIAQVATKMLPAIIESALVAQTGARLAGNRAQLSEEEFQNLQGHALAVCRRYQGAAPVPVFVQPNTWTVKELEYDLDAVLFLTVQALVFNLTSFFEGDGLTQILSSIPGLLLSTSSNTTA